MVLTKLSPWSPENFLSANFTISANMIRKLNSASSTKKQKAENIFLAGGGPVANALVVMQKLGVQTEIIGGFGSDNAGQYLLEDFEKYGVNTKNATIVAGASSFTSYIVLAQDKATRTCVFDRGSVPDEEKNLNSSRLNAIRTHYP